MPMPAMVVKSLGHVQVISAYDRDLAGCNDRFSAWGRGARLYEEEETMLERYSGRAIEPVDDARE
jgi:hypothetical protein